MIVLAAPVQRQLRANFIRHIGPNFPDDAAEPCFGAQSFGLRSLLNLGFQFRGIANVMSKISFQM